MLVIRSAQIQEFIATDDDQLAKVVAEAVRKACPDRVISFDDTELERAVRLGFERARSHGLTAAEDIAAFVAIMFEVAPRFDEQAEVKLVLDDPAFPPSVRFGQLFARTADGAWNEAGRRYEDSFWFPDNK
jgi:hypothetical protein